MTATIANSIAVIGVTAVTTFILFQPRIVGSSAWRATVTPLASIIGSGFLILGPLLDRTYGAYAVLAMALLCAAAYAFGSAIRFNIRQLASETGIGRVAGRLDRLSSWALAFAYVVSVAYYVRLFGSFAVELTPVNDAEHARLVTTAVLAAIGLYGLIRGLRALEHVEQVAVGLKLGIIAGLIVGLAFYLVELNGGGTLPEPSLPTLDRHGILVGFGLLITVQGFETSRYLGAEYDAETRIRTMRNAQLIATAIYLVYIALSSAVFPGIASNVSETAIIDLTRVVAPILPVLLIVAALAAQLSAALADTNGGGGLFEEMSGARFRATAAYVLITGLAIVLVWVADIFEIISYASRAFAVYYALQAAVATMTALGARKRPGGLLRVGFFAFLTLLAGAIAAVGIPAE
ncbi:hypothetical protein [Oceanibacterium hippocampi]|uniref:Uncharacterized protein n=1 Tax=Oceanibacterium hippocampi TaxID=745714 RepID=A0A1Y5THI1_9PROT|nr:hypothetical protein [Oceanibacterium hippocampi]SLN64038.1 hypothetical protein OCH7691_02889 [Oceanibacterium hippocampi]